MKMIQKSVLVGALLAASCGAWAVTANASLSNIKVQVFDLTPLDGIAPSFTVLAGDYFYTSAYTQSGLSDYQNGLPSTASLSAAGLQLSGSMVGTSGDLASYSLSASALDTQLSTYGYAYAQASIGLSIEVGAGTLVLVSADTAVTANGTGSVNNTYVYGYSSLGFYEYDNGVQVGSSGYRQAYTGFNYTNLTPASSGPISASFANFGAGATIIRAQAYAQANISTPMAPVPEPTSLAMLLSGLGVAAGVAHRRRQRQG